jgi:Protease inhibitor Inh
MRRRLHRPCVTAIAAALGLVLSAGVLQAQDLKADPALATAMAGGYNLASVDGGKECRFQLGAERSEDGFRLFLPPGCRTAFPFLRPAASWTLDADGNLVLAGPKAIVLATFVIASDTLLELRNANGVATHQLVSTEPGWALRRRQALGGGADPPKTAEPAQPAVPEKPPEPPKPVVSMPKAMEGWYQVVRSGGKKSDCRVAFLSADALETGAKAAALDERCADKGMLIFRPVGWRMEGEQLILTAKRGHELVMAKKPAGTWAKAVPSGEELELKRLE